MSVRFGQNGSFDRVDRAFRGLVAFETRVPLGVASGEGSMSKQTKKRLVSGAVLVVMATLTGFAAAQDVKSSDADGGYGYEFSDDPLSAGNFGPNDATIRVRPGPVRATLIRPRTSFVPEMLKSVENL